MPEYRHVVVFVVLMIRRADVRGVGMLPGLQALRFFAALSIVVLHLGFPLLERPVVVLWLGVPIFFALSGFLMAKLMVSARAGQFILDRALRIYPAYWLAVILWMALFPVTFNPLALTLVPSGPIQLPLFDVVWTLI